MIGYLCLIDNKGGGFLQVYKLIKKIVGPDLFIKIKSDIAFRNNPTLKEKIQRNSVFRGAYSGKRCFILGNGPSLKNIDLSRFKNELIFTVNQIARNPQFELLHTNFHFWADERFFDLDEKKPEDMELLETMKNVRTRDNDPVVFYKYVAKDMVEKFGLDDYLNIYYYEQFNTDIDFIKDGYIDFTYLVPGFPTVVQYIICMAVYMGFSEIILLGCDCSGFISIAESKLGCGENAQYGYKITENEKKRLERANSMHSLKDELRWHVLLFENYRLLNIYCEKNNCRLYNATSPTLLEEVPKINLDDVLTI